MTDKLIPRLPAYPTYDGRVIWLRIWCCWCNQWHTHANNYGHRVAHCLAEDSPYWDAGYVLANPEDFEYEYWQAHKHHTEITEDDR